TGTSSWFVPGNWTQNLLPTLTQRVVVDNGTTVQVGAAPDGEVKAEADSLIIGRTSPGSTLQMVDGGDLTLNGHGIVIGPQGTLRFSGTLGINVGSIHQAGRIDNSGTILYDGTKNHFLSNIVTGSGKLVMEGTGTFLIVSNLALAETTISAGILQLGNGGTSGSITGNVTNNSMLV